MGSERRQQRRRERQRSRRGGRQQQQVTYEPIGKMKLPGIMGWFQGNPRFFYVGGIAVMVLSLGAIFFGSQGGIHSGQPTVDDIAGTATPAPTSTAAAAEADATTEPAATDQSIQRVYAAPPAFEIDVTNSYEVVILTEKGEIRIELLPEEAPGYVNNFVFLARNNFYDGLVFHRVVEGFVAQAGDPTATGFTGSGYVLEEETNDLQFDAGVLAMAKAGSSVNGSQFFITLEPAPHLNGQFTVFGRVTEGMDVVRALTKRNPGDDQPPGDRIISIEVLENGEADPG